MTKFGETLRAFREASNDPNRGHRRLSQARLGELMGHEMEDRGFSGAAVSDWEKGKSTIRAESRTVLLALIRVLHTCGGLRTLGDANQLLEAGNYRTLDQEETRKIFGEIADGSPIEESMPARRISRSWAPILLESIFSIPEDEVQTFLDKIRQGPSPSWPRVLAALMRKASERWSLSITSIAWAAVWLLAWWWIPPSLRWPFANRDSAFSAMVMYVGGTLVVPLLIGSLVGTRNNEYWKQNDLAHSKLLRLYTYQGAGIGFHLGYFFIFPFVLIRYYLHLESSVWLELAAVTLGLLFGRMGAHVVPYNLWLAYRRLHLADGAIFFVVALLGPFWGIFFLEYHPLLLIPFWGSLVILLAMVAVVIIGMRQSREKE